MTSTPSAAPTGSPWRTVGRVSTAQPQALVRTAPGAGPQPVSLALHSITDPGFFFLSLCDLTEVYLRFSRRGPGAALILSSADQMCGAAGADPDD